VSWPVLAIVGLAASVSATPANTPPSHVDPVYGTFTQNHQEMSWKLEVDGRRYPGYPDAG
jgi:hypothetical protein